jgi:hypothetical protein
MVVPGAGAVMAIIEGLQAAWGTVSKILAAIDKFISFLKAVKGGGAGPQFAAAVAAGAVAVIDFVANWLLQRLMKPAKKVSGKLAAMAKKIMAKRKKGLKKVGEKLKKAFKTLKKKAKGLLKSKGKKRRKGDKTKEKKKKKPEKKKETNAEKQARLDRAIAEAKQFVQGKRRLGLILKGKLFLIRRKHKLKSMTATTTSPGEYSIRGTINPTAVFTATAIDDTAKAVAAKLVGISAKSRKEFMSKAKAPKGYRLVPEKPSATEESYNIVLVKNDGQRAQVGALVVENQDGSTSRTTGPSTNPNSPHNKKIRETIEAYRKRGYKLESGGISSRVKNPMAEVEMDTSGTASDYDTRRADIVMYHAGKKDRVYINVGKALQRASEGHPAGAPVIREREAAEDIKQSPDFKGRFRFVRYN